MLAHRGMHSLDEDTEQQVLKLPLDGKADSKPHTYNSMGLLISLY